MNRAADLPAPDVRARHRLVARSGDLPDLSAQLPGQQRRRHRRPAGDCAALAAHRRDGRRCDLDLAVLHLSDEGFRLRRLRLLRRRPDVRQPRRFRYPDPGGAPARSEGDDRPRAVAQLARASLVQGKPQEQGQLICELVRLGRCQARRHPAQQLAFDLRRLCLAMGADALPVLPAQLPDRAARPQFPRAARAGDAAGHGPLLAGSRRRRLPARYDQLLPARRTAARQPAPAARRAQPDHRAGGEPLQLAEPSFRQDPAREPRVPAPVPRRCWTNTTPPRWARSATPSAGSRSWPIHRRRRSRAHVLCLRVVVPTAPDCRMHRRGHARGRRGRGRRLALLGLLEPRRAAPCHALEPHGGRRARSTPRC